MQENKPPRIAARPGGRLVPGSKDVVLSPPSTPKAAERWVPVELDKVDAEGLPLVPRPVFVKRAVGVEVEELAAYLVYPFAVQLSDHGFDVRRL